MGAKSGRIGLSSATSTAAGKRAAMYIKGDSVPSDIYKPKTKHALASAVSRFSKGSQLMSETKTVEQTLVLSTDHTMMMSPKSMNVFNKKMKGFK